MTDAGHVLFARYAYAPNERGYCGPADAAALFELGAGADVDADIAAIARRFSGAWPYAALLAELTGIEDPLDERVMRAYWTGGELLDQVDVADFGVKLIEALSAQAGHYWAHLTPELVPEAAPTHSFHVFAVYPWTRLLTAGSAQQPLHVLDNCRIRWGDVLGVETEHVLVRCRRLTWNGCRLGLGAAGVERVRYAVDGRSFVGEPVVGDTLALHWDWACERLDSAQRDYLRRWTGRQLRVTNVRLAREGECAQ